jgi:hypothetical protein
MLKLILSSINACPNLKYLEPTSSEKSKDLGILSQIVTPEDFEKLIEPYKNFNIFKGIFSK